MNTRAENQTTDLSSLCSVPPTALALRRGRASRAPEQRKTLRAPAIDLDQFRRIGSQASASIWG